MASLVAQIEGRLLSVLRPKDAWMREYIRHMATRCLEWSKEPRDYRMPVEGEDWEE